MTHWPHRLGRYLNAIIASVCVIAILVIWLSTLQRIASERQQAVAAAMEASSNLAIAYEQQVIRMLMAAEQVASFAREQYRRQGVDLNLTRLVEDGLIRDTMFTIISVVNEEGDIVDSSVPTSNVNYADRAFFRAQRQSTEDKLFVNEPVMGRVSAQWRLPMSLRISHHDGSFAGVVVMSVDPVSLTGFYRQANLGKQGVLELTGLDGMVRARKIGAVNSFGQNAAELAWFQRQHAAPEGSFLDDGRTVDGVARIVSYRTMHGYPLMVTVGTAYADELAPVQQRRTQYLAAAAAATVALLLFSGLLAWLHERQRKAVDALMSSEALYRATFHQAAMGIAHIAPDGRILRANEKFCLMLGYNTEELRLRTIFDLSDHDNRDTAQHFFNDRLSSQSPALSPDIEKPYQRKDGSIVWVCEALGVVADQRGKPEFLVAVAQDITARKGLEKRLSHFALHDALTGLPNRVSFHDRLAAALESAKRGSGLAAVLYLDLDGFKEVNDCHGHAVGDALLQRVGQRLKNGVRAGDTVARLGGDEFGIVLTSLNAEADVDAVAVKLVNALSRPYDIQGITATISASIGAAVFPEHGQDGDALVAHADLMMYAGKHADKTTGPDMTQSNPVCGTRPAMITI